MMMYCSLPNCSASVLARGMCSKHYTRWRRNGDPTVKTSKPPRSAADRFWPKVDADGACWEWTGATNGNGYGNFWDGEGYLGAHRWSYEHLVGSIPEGLVLDHLCRNTACVNPDHLEPVTQKVNNERGYGAPHHKHTKTHCPRGHPYSDENTYRLPGSGGRVCRRCQRLRVFERELADDTDQLLGG